MDHGFNTRRNHLRSRASPQICFYSMLVKFSAQSFRQQSPLCIPARFTNDKTN
jgi:hypothetical protein